MTCQRAAGLRSRAPGAGRVAVWIADNGVIGGAAAGLTKCRAVDYCRVAAAL
jgi:hypothetical protein